MKARTKKQRQLLRELKNSALIEKACRRIGVARSTFYRWCESDPAFKTAAKNAQEVGRAKTNDFVESKLLESINNGSVQAMRFWLVHNSKIYSTINAEEIKRLRFYEGVVSELLNAAAKENDTAVLRIFHSLLAQAKQADIDTQ